LNTIADDILDVAHIGCTVSDLDDTKIFLKSFLSEREFHTQFIDKPYLSGVIGFPECAIQMGFTDFGSNGGILELLDYKNPRSELVDFTLDRPGTGYLDFTVTDIKKHTEQMILSGASLINTSDASIITLNKSSKNDNLEKKYFFKTPTGILIAINEDKSISSLRLTSTGFYVIEIAPLLKFFARLGYTFISDKKSENNNSVILKNKGAGPYLVLHECAAPPEGEIQIESNMTGNIHICVRVKDIDCIFDKMISMGATPTGKPTNITAGVNEGTRAGYITIPDGIKLELFQGKNTQL